MHLLEPSFSYSIKLFMVACLQSCTCLKFVKLSPFKVLCETGNTEFIVSLHCLKHNLPLSGPEFRYSFFLN